MSVVKGVGMNPGFNPARPPMMETDFSRRDLIAMAALAAAAFFFRLYCLPNYDVISNDGTAYVRIAREMRLGNFAGVSSYGFYPVFVWLAGTFFQDLETAGRLVSILFGSLLVVPVYMLGTELFNRRTAFAACLLMIFWASLRHWSCEVMTQSSYITLALTGIYLVWRMMRSSSMPSAVMAGLFMGLAYVTRTEAILLCILTPLPLLFAFRKEFKSKLPFVAAYIAVFALIVGANLLLVRNATGSWQLASKTSVALMDAISYIRDIPDMNYIPGVEPTGYLQILTDYPSFILINTIKNIADLIKTFIPLPFWILFLIGFVSGGIKGTENLKRLFLMTTFAPLVVIIVYYYIGPEYTQAYIPVILLYSAEGLRVTEARIAGFLSSTSLPSRIKGWLPYNPLMLATAFLFAFVTMYGQIPESSARADYTPESDGGRRDQKNLGLLIKDKLPPGKIMTRWSRIAFYADREWMNIPNTGYDGIIADAKANGVRFLICDGGLWAIRPQLGDELFAPFIPGANPNGIFFSASNFIVKPGLRAFMLYINNPGSMGVAVYEVI